MRGAASLFASLTCWCLSACAPVPAEYYGIAGGIAWTRTSLALDTAASRARDGATIKLGARACALCWKDYEDVSVSGLLAYSFTDVRGMTRERDPYAFSRVDLGGVVGWRIRRWWNIRPYAGGWLKNGRTAEIERDTLTRDAPAPGTRTNVWPINFVDPSGDRTYTFGLEVPLTLEGRGLDVSFTPLSGRFRYSEFRRDSLPANLPYRGWQMSIGWSGPFTGTGLPWR